MNQTLFGPEDTSLGGVGWQIQAVLLRGCAKGDYALQSIMASVPIALGLKERGGEINTGGEWVFSSRSAMWTSAVQQAFLDSVVVQCSLFKQAPSRRKKLTPCVPRER